MAVVGRRQSVRVALIATFDDTNTRERGSPCGIPTIGTRGSRRRRRLLASISSGGDTMNLQRAGGIAAVIQALAYIVGFAVMATLLDPGNVDGWSATRKLAFTLERKSLVQVFNIVIYVVFGVALVVLAVSLHDRLRRAAPGLMGIASAFGLIWAGLVIASGMVSSIGLDYVARLYAQDTGQATSAWVAIGAVQDGLGGGVEIVGGLWALLVSVAAWRSRVFPRLLNSVGIAVGLAGVLTVIPPLKELGAVFGLGQIVWFAWLGAHLLGDATSPAQHVTTGDASGGELVGDWRR